MSLPHLSDSIQVCHQLAYQNEALVLWEESVDGREEEASCLSLLDA